MTSNQTLQRGLNVTHVQLISLGGIIGSCYFLGIGDSIQKLGPSVVIALLFGGFIVWLVSNGIGELCLALPREGGFISHARELVGRPWAAGVGWSYWINWCAYIPSEMIAGGIIMSTLVPGVSTLSATIFFGVFISLVNLCNIRSFGHVESFLALIKIFAIIVFCAVALLIWLGLIGTNPHFMGLEDIDPKVNFSSLFPISLFVIVQRMVMILINYQGTEIVALSAAETENPEKNIPIAIRNVTIRIIAIFIIPVILILLIMPYKNASVSVSVFVSSLQYHGLKWGGLFFSIVIISAAISCANSGLYASARTLYFLSRERLGPRIFSKLNRHSTPLWASLFTILISWAFIPLFLFYDGATIFKWLLAVSGFTGAICWISISWCQLLFRKRIIANGYKTEDLRFYAPGFPFFAYVSIGLQLACLVFVAFDSELRVCLYLGVPSLVIPMLVVYFRDKLKKKQYLHTGTHSSEEKSIDSLFPSKILST